MQIFKSDKSIIVAADVPQHELRSLCKVVKGVNGIGGMKIGITQVGKGLNKATERIREVLGFDIPIIYDHQKGGNDIPDMGASFARTLRLAGINAAILFPFTGPATQEAWTKALQDEDIGVMIGGIMTHEKFLVSEGGYIDDAAVMKIYDLSVKLSVTDFVVPGTKINWVISIKKFMDKNLGEGKYSLSAPGFIKQGGVISECGNAAGPRFNAIVGSAIYTKKTCEEMRAAAIEMTKQIA